MINTFSIFSRNLNLNSFLSTTRFIFSANFVYNSFFSKTNKLRAKERKRPHHSRFFPRHLIFIVRLYIYIYIYIYIYVI